MINYREISQLRFEENLKKMLDTNIFSGELYSNKQRKTIIESLLKLRHSNEYGYSQKRDDIRGLEFSDYFSNICNFVAALLKIEMCISYANKGLTGVHTKVSHQTKSIIDSHPELCTYCDDKVRKTRIIVEIIESLFTRQKNFNYKEVQKDVSKIVSEMISNKIKKGILTDSYNVILVEIDPLRSSNLKNMPAEECTLKRHQKNTYSHLNETQKDGKGSFLKHIPVAYKVLNCQSSGLTMIGAITSFIYDEFKDDPNHIPKAINDSYQFIRGMNDNVNGCLQCLTEFANDAKPYFQRHCKRYNCQLERPLEAADTVQLTTGQGTFYSGTRYILQWGR